jgi:hypothetical protein
MDKLKEATHVSKCGRFLYRKRRISYCSLLGRWHKFEFWDTYTNQWRASIVHDCDLDQL